MARVAIVGPLGWDRARIKAELRRQHGSITVLSSSWGYHRAAITCALRRTDYSVSLERRIAAALNLPPHLIWPDRWRPNGTPRRRPVIEADPNRADRGANSQKREAA
jgi:Ner family transcriptional regulator